jgi:enamine deaminase RidA (YjgF/YER057c/UK114 family)
VKGNPVSELSTEDRLDTLEADYMALDKQIKHVFGCLNTINTKILTTFERIAEMETWYSRLARFDKRVRVLEDQKADLLAKSSQENAVAFMDVDGTLYQGPIKNGVNYGLSVAELVTMVNSLIEQNHTLITQIANNKP